MYDKIERVEAGESGDEELSQIEWLRVAEVDEAEDVARDEEKETDGDGEGGGESGDESMGYAMVLGAGVKEGQEGPGGVVVEDQKRGEEAKGGERVGAPGLGWCGRAGGVHCDIELAGRGFYSRDFGGLQLELAWWWIGRCGLEGRCLTAG